MRTREEITRILDLAEYGRSSGQIAREMKMSRSTVTSICIGRGIKLQGRPGGPPAPPWTAADDAKLRELAAAGRTDREIARALGRSARPVRDRRRALKLYRGTWATQAGASSMAGWA